MASKPQSLVQRSNLALVAASEDLKLKSKKRKQTQVVLEEDDYIQTLEHIIQRDYFPALPALDSVLSGQVPATPSSSRPPKRTPVSRSFEETETPLAPATPGIGEIKKDESVATEEVPPKTDKKDMKLNEFLARHTSEDNEAFEELVARDEIKLTEKRLWLAEQVKQAENLHNIFLENNPKRTGVLQSWEFKPINNLLYFPTEHHELPYAGIGPEKTIDLKNTRFPGGFFDKPKTKDIELANTSIQEANRDSVLAGGTPQVGGYKFLRTPSPMPGSGGESPMVTWGDVIGTPLHLEEEDELEKKRKSKVSHQFQVPATPSRDEILLKLNEKVMQKKKTKSKKKRADAASPLTSVGRSTPSLTPAALNLLKRSVRRPGSVLRADSQLRASYTNSPQLFPSAARLTPQGARPTPSPLPKSIQRQTPIPSPSVTPTR